MTGSNQGVKYGGTEVERKYIIIVFFDLPGKSQHIMKLAGTQQRDMVLSWGHLFRQKGDSWAWHSLCTDSSLRSCVTYYDHCHPTPRLLHHSRGWPCPLWHHASFPTRFLILPLYDYDKQKRVSDALDWNTIPQLCKDPS